jgi:Tc5 transposase DNA-binding domain
VLLGYIDRLTDRHIPPTTQIIRNLAEELVNGPVGKNWTARFVQRHKDRISSTYLRPLDRARCSAENSTAFKHFYRLILF